MNVATVKRSVPWNYAKAISRPLEGRCDPGNGTKTVSRLGRTRGIPPHCGLFLPNRNQASASLPRAPAPPQVLTAGSSPQ